MAFWGQSFVFNDIPCEEFGLVLYNIGEHSHSSGTFASSATIVEEQLATRWKPIFYGTKLDKKLEFTIVFGVNSHRADNRHYLDRYELEAIANWLTGHNQYHWLEIKQNDLEYFRYHCMITNLEMIEYGDMPWALKAKVTCDSPYAYQYEQTFIYEVTDGDAVSFANNSGHNGYYYPKMEIDPTYNTMTASAITASRSFVYPVSCEDAVDIITTQDGSRIAVKRGHQLNADDLAYAENSIQNECKRYRATITSRTNELDDSGSAGSISGVYYPATINHTTKTTYIPISCELVYERVENYPIITDHNVDMSQIDQQIEEFRIKYNGNIRNMILETDFTGDEGYVKIEYGDDGSVLDKQYYEGMECVEHYIPEIDDYVAHYVECEIGYRQIVITDLHNPGNEFYFLAPIESDLAGTIMMNGTEYFLCDASGIILNDSTRDGVFITGQYVKVSLDSEEQLATIIEVKDDIGSIQVSDGSDCLDRLVSGVEDPMKHYISCDISYQLMELSGSVIEGKTIVQIKAPCDQCAGVRAVVKRIVDGTVVEDIIPTDFIWTEDDTEFISGETLYVQLDATTNSAKLVDSPGVDFMIINHTDNDRVFAFNAMPHNDTTISIDNDLGIIESTSDLNPYQYFNFNFFRLVHGINELTVYGNGTLKIICEFPANVGG